MPPPQTDFAQVFGPTIVRRDAGPYSDGQIIQTEIVAMELTGNTGANGPVIFRQSPAQPSLGGVVNVVTDGSGNLVSGDSFFDIVFEIEFPMLGLTAIPASPVHIRTSVDSMPPRPGTTHQSQPGASTPLLNKNTGNQIGWSCATTHSVNTYTNCQRVCVYELTCISGHPSDVAGLGLAVGDRRRTNDMCVNTCPDIKTQLTADSGTVCMWWHFVECAPSNLPVVPGTIVSDCPCDKYCVYTVQCISGHPDDIAALGIPPGKRFKQGTCVNTCPELKSIVPGRHGPVCIHWKLEGCLPESGNPDVIGRLVFECACTPTMNSVPSCAGYSSCPTSPSCPNYISCYNTPTFCMASCPWYATCERYPSCPGNPSCPNYPSCETYPSCPYYPSCYSTPTCEGAVTCTGAPPAFDSSYYPAVFSVDGPINPAEGLRQPDVPGGHPAPNDVFALGFAGPWAYFTEGEIFESKPPGPGVPPAMTNIDRISASLGVGVAPGGPPYTGPFAPNPGAPDPAPSSATLGMGTLGLVSTDNIDALSFGRDGGNVLLFSVDPEAIGTAGTAVYAQSTMSPAAPPVGTPPPSNGGGDPGSEAAGDIYRSPQYTWFGGPANVVLLPAPSGNNTLDLDEAQVGLQAPAHTYNALPDSIEDDLDALEATDALSVDSDADGLVENPDSAIYFSLTLSSPSVFTSAVVSEDDILVSPAPGGGAFTFGVYADGVSDLGLLDGDNIDGIAVWDVVPRGVWSADDEILFSLSAGSPSLDAAANPNMPGPGPFAPGDVFRKGFAPSPGPIAMYATAASLGLLGTDELDALDIGRCDCRWDSDESGQGDVCEPGFTDVGAGVTVTLAPCVVITFDSVSLWGVSAVTISATGPAGPSGYSILPLCAPASVGARASSTQGGYAEVTTSADYVVDPGPPNIEVCIAVETTVVSGPAQNLKMFHYEEVSPGNFQWVDITTAVTTAGSAFQVCGAVSALSTFIVAEPVLCACNCHADPVCDGVINNIQDVVVAVNVAFRGAPAVPDPNPSCPYETTDVNCDGVTSVLDVVKIVNVAFRGSTPATEYCDPCP
ncbi:MAG TPA: hypothetical protein VNN55_02125 [bacterium]|nr:hypothetical protein [bacterium]